VITFVNKLFWLFKN